MPVLASSGGVLTGADVAAVNSALTFVQPDFYIDGNYGYDANPGTSPGLAFKTPAPLDYLLPLFRKNNNTSRKIVVGFSGVLNYEWSTPKVNDVYLVGLAGYPRQATTSSVWNGGGATWLSPTSGSAALLQPNGQGWVVDNIFFNNSATAAPCVQLVNAGDPPTSNCSESFILQNCTLTGSDDGLKASDNPNHVLIRNNIFRGFSGSGDGAITYAVGLGTGTLLNWRITGNQFLGNANHVTIATAGAEIDHNSFSYIWGGTTTTTQLVLTSGNDNYVHDNAFALPYSTNNISGMFAQGTNDRWGPNSFSTAVTTTIFSFGEPSC